jgi:hypothetical protein
VTGWFSTGVSITLFIYIGQTFGYHVIFTTFGILTLICFFYNAIYMINIKPRLKDVVNVELAKLQLNSTASSDYK